MKAILYILTITFSIWGFMPQLYAQNPPIKVSGQVIEKNGEQAIPFATVAIYDKETQEMRTGTTTDMDGNFELRTENASIYIEVSFIGFQTLNIENFEVQNNAIQLGKIVLTDDAQLTEEIVVTEERSTTEFRIDKKVFNVGKDLSSTGASALEVLDNVPSVTVNIEGEISLRGNNGVQILIDGKPSVLADDQGNALGTITADMIEKVEVITNPSAKYEAEGSVGIINIVLKKEEKKGINGSLSLNTGYPHNHSAGLSLNYRSSKFNFFGQFGAGYRSLPRFNEQINDDLVNNSLLITDGIEYRNETFFNTTLGMDYYINKNNTLTISGNFAYEIESQPSESNFFLYQNESLVNQWYRTESTNATNPKFQYDVQYKRDFKDHEEHDLMISATGNFFGKTLTSDFEDTYTLGNIDNSFQRTATSFQESRYTFKIDYTKPFSDKIKLEVGAQYLLNGVSNDFAVSNLVDGAYVLDSSFTNIFDFNQNVLGLYSSGSYENNKWGVKVGLRAEYTDLDTELRNTGETNKRDFVNLFPSAHFSYNVSKRISLQAGYSRRIFRPRLWDLNPFFNIRNNFSIRVGNPDLEPEFSNSYDLNAIYILDKMTINFGVYHLHTTNLIERISTFENNVTTVMPLNIGKRWSTGTEINIKYTPAKWLVLTGDFNYNYFTRKGVFEGQSFDFDASRWTSRLSSRFKLPADFEIELVGNYESRFLTVQGEMKENAFANIGIRKKINKGKMVFSLSVRDIFASRNRTVEILNDDFYLYSTSRRGRFITLGFSYGFGKGEAMEYSGRRR